MLFNENHTSQCDVKACVVPPSSSYTVQSSVHVHKEYRVELMFTEYRVVFTFTINMEEVFMFTKNMEYTVNVHDQKQYIVQFIMFTNRTARICL